MTTVKNHSQIVEGDAMCPGLFLQNKSNRFLTLTFVPVLLCLDPVHRCTGSHLLIVATLSIQAFKLETWPCCVLDLTRKPSAAAILGPWLCGSICFVWQPRFWEERSWGCRCWMGFSWDFFVVRDLSYSSFVHVRSRKSSTQIHTKH